MKQIGIFPLAIKNLKRKPVRTSVLLLFVAVVTGAILAATIFIAGMQNALKIGTYRLGADVLVVPAQHVEQAKSALLAGEPASFYMDASVLDRVRSIEGVRRASPQLFVKPSSFTCCYNVETFLIAFDPATDFTVTPWLTKKLRKPLAEDEAIVGSSLPVVTDDMLPFFGSPFTVVGTMAPTGMKFFDQSVFMTMDAAYAMAEQSRNKSMQPITIDKSKISAVLVQADESFGPDRVAIRIEHDIDGVKAIASDEAVSTVRRQLGGLIQGILIISAVIWLLSLLMMGFAFYMIVNERQREIGLLRAMGANRRHVFLLFVAEASVLSFFGGLAGIASGAGVLAAIKGLVVSSLKLPYLFPPGTVLAELIAGALVFAVLTGLIASVLPARSASRLDPYEAVRKGE